MTKLESACLLYRTSPPAFTNPSDRVCNPDMLLDSLEGHVVSVFDSTFRDRKPGDLFKDKNKLNEFDSSDESDAEEARERAERAERMEQRRLAKKEKDRGPTTYGQAGKPFREALVPAGQQKTSKSGLKGFHQWVKEHGGEKFEEVKDKMALKIDVLEDHAEKFEDALDKACQSSIRHRRFLTSCYITVGQGRSSGEAGRTSGQDNQGFCCGEWS